MVDDSGLRRKMAKLRPKVEAAVKPLMERYADQLVSQMKVLVPVDSGALRDSIRWTWGSAPDGSMTIATVAGRKVQGIFITIYAGGGEAFYARWQEFGTKNMPANPFFFVTWRGNRRRVRSGITRAVSKAIKEI